MVNLVVLGMYLPVAEPQFVWPGAGGGSKSKTSCLSSPQEYSSLSLFWGEVGARDKVSPSPYPSLIYISKRKLDNI